MLLRIATFPGALMPSGTRQVADAPRGLATGTTSPALLARLTAKIDGLDLPRRYRQR